MESYTNTVRSSIEQGSAFDSISQPSDNLRQKEEALRWWREHLEQIYRILWNQSEHTEGARWKMLTPAEKEVEIRESIDEAYRTIMKGKVLTISLLEDIWSRIKMLEEDMLVSENLSFCKYLSFVAPNLHSTCELRAWKREVDREKRITGSVGEDSRRTIFITKNPTADRLLIGDAAIHPQHVNAAITSKASFSIGSTKQMEKHEDSDVEGGRNEHVQYFQRNALFASGTAFLTLGGTVISAVLTTDFENKSNHFKALAKSLCISSIALGLSGIMVGVLAFRCDHRRLPLASSIFYTSGLVITAILVAFGILAVIGI